MYEIKIKSLISLFPIVVNMFEFIQTKIVQIDRTLTHSFLVLCAYMFLNLNAIIDKVINVFK